MGFFIVIAAIFAGLTLWATIDNAHLKRTYRRCKRWLGVVYRKILRKKEEPVTRYDDDDDGWNNGAIDYSNPNTYAVNNRDSSGYTTAHPPISSASGPREVRTKPIDGSKLQKK